MEEVAAVVPWVVAVLVQILQQQHSVVVEEVAVYRRRLVGNCWDGTAAVDTFRLPKDADAGVWIRVGENVSNEESSCSNGGITIMDGFHSLDNRMRCLYNIYFKI